MPHLRSRQLALVVTAVLLLALMYWCVRTPQVIGAQRGPDSTNVSHKLAADSTFISFPAIPADPIFFIRSDTDHAIYIRYIADDQVSPEQDGYLHHFRWTVSTDCTGWGHPMYRLEGTDKTASLSWVWLDSINIPVSGNWYGPIRLLHPDSTYIPSTLAPLEGRAWITILATYFDADGGDSGYVSIISQWEQP